MSTTGPYSTAILETERPEGILEQRSFAILSLSVRDLSEYKLGTKNTNASANFHHTSSQRAEIVELRDRYLFSSH